MGPNKGHCFNAWDSKPSRPSFQSLLATQHLQTREPTQGSSVLSGPGSQAAHLKLLKTHLLHLGYRASQSSNRTPQSGCLAPITQGCVGTASPALPGTRQRTETCITSLRKNHTQNPDHPDGQPVENPQVKMSPAAEGSPLCRWKPQPCTV